MMIRLMMSHLSNDEHKSNYIIQSKTPAVAYIWVYEIRMNFVFVELVRFLVFGVMLFSVVDWPGDESLGYLLFDGWN